MIFNRVSMFCWHKIRTHNVFQSYGIRLLPLRATENLRRKLLQVEMHPMETDITTGTVDLLANGQHLLPSLGKQ